MTYTHVSAPFYARVSDVPWVALNAYGNAQRRRQAEALAQTQWREVQSARALVTTHRLICELAHGRWLSFYYGAATAIHPEPANWSLVLDFRDAVPLRLTGLGAPIAAVAAVWAIHGVDGLEHDPRLEPLRVHNAG